MERFFVYSMEHDRLIRLIWQDASDEMCQSNVKVLAWDGKQVTIKPSAPKGR